MTPLGKLILQSVAILALIFVGVADALVSDWEHFAIDMVAMVALML